jgi:hypothetical protein
MNYPLTAAEQVVVVMMAGFSAGILIAIPITLIFVG